MFTCYFDKRKTIFISFIVSVSCLYLCFFLCAFSYCMLLWKKKKKPLGKESFETWVTM